MSQRVSEIVVSEWELYALQHVQAKYPLATPSLQARLANTNLQRRKFSRYQELHREKLNTADTDQTGGFDRPEGTIITKISTLVDLNPPLALATEGILNMEMESDGERTETAFAYRDISKN